MDSYQVATVHHLRKAANDLAMLMQHAENRYQRDALRRAAQQLRCVDCIVANIHESVDDAEAED